MIKINVNDLMEFTKENSNRKEIFKREPIDTGLLLYMPGQKTTEHMHSNMDEIFYVINGEGTITINGESAPLREGDTIYSPRGEKHGFYNTGNNNLTVLQIKLTD